MLLSISTWAFASAIILNSYEYRFSLPQIVMRIWNQSILEISKRVDFTQYEFLNCPLASSYLLILVELYRAREERIQVEVPFENLFELVSEELKRIGGLETFDSMALRKMLNQLSDWKNVSLRLEPKRIRRIQDRGLDRYLIRLTETTNKIVFQIEQQLQQASVEADSSIRFSLTDVEELLTNILVVMQGTEPSHPELFKVARQLTQARKAVEDASNELMRLDLWLSETALQKPDRNSLAELLGSLSSYFERYLGEVEQRRQRCNEKLEQLIGNEADEFFAKVQSAWQIEIADDPSRQGIQLPNPNDIVSSVSDFLKSAGILESRREAVHQRLADVTGHLKRVLAEVVRRSQLVSGLRELSSKLLRVPDEVIGNGVVDELFLRLWQPGHCVFDGSLGSPKEQTTPVRPFSNYVRTKVRFSGATIRPKSQSKVAERSTLIKQMDDLNEFVERVILRGEKEVHVIDVKLADWNEIKMFLTAVRFVRLDRSYLRRRLKFRVTMVDNPKGKAIAIATERGRLRVPQMVISKVR